ncbi:hypothetical protein GF336_03995 [Candidatus Woesearchaeota archaeon]|nr:hypothetical protein [Candidatus Woesearchaeota archaeon]
MKLRNFLKKIPNNKNIWTLEALRFSEEWSKIRAKALKLLKSFKIKQKDPNLFWISYIPEKSKK